MDLNTLLYQRITASNPTFENDMHAAWAHVFIIVYRMLLSIYKKGFLMSLKQLINLSQQWLPFLPTTFFFLTPRSTNQLTLFPLNHTLLISMSRRDHLRRPSRGLCREPTELRHPQDSSRWRTTGSRRRRMFAGGIEKLKNQRVWGTRGGRSKGKMTGPG